MPLRRWSMPLRDEKTPAVAGAFVCSDVVVPAYSLSFSLRRRSSRRCLTLSMTRRYSSYSSVRSPPLQTECHDRPGTETYAPLFCQLSPVEYALEMQRISMPHPGCGHNVCSMCRLPVLQSSLSAQHLRTLPYFDWPIFAWHVLHGRKRFRERFVEPRLPVAHAIADKLFVLFAFVLNDFKLNAMIAGIWRYVPDTTAYDVIRYFLRKCGALPWRRPGNIVFAIHTFRYYYRAHCISPLNISASAVSASVHWSRGL